MLHFLRGDGVTPAAKLDELAVVALLRPVEVDGRTLETGSKGTIVAAYADGLAFEVEFETPFHAVVTLGRDDISR